MGASRHTVSANQAVVDDESHVLELSNGTLHHHLGTAPDVVATITATRDALDAMVMGHDLQSIVIRDLKGDAMAAGPGLDIVSALRSAPIGSLTGYLAAVLSDDSPAVSRLVDDLVADAVEYAQAGVASGVLRPSDDPYGRAALLVLWSLGGLVLHRHAHRLLGVDLLDPDMATSPQMARYLGPVYEVFGHGIFSDAMASTTQQAVDDLAAAGEDTDV